MTETKKDLGACAGTDTTSGRPAGVTAKFTVASVEDFGAHRKVKLTPVYSNDPKSPNYSWSKWTPSGSIELTITNPLAYEQFKPGKTYFVDFQQEVEAEVAPSTAA